MAGVSASLSCCSQRQSDLLQELDYARVFAQFSEPRVHLKFRDGQIVVLGSLF